MPQFSPTEKKIAACILDSPDQIINETITHLAKRCGTSVGSIVNFSGLMGFKGFSNLKVAIAHSMGEKHQIAFDDVRNTDAPKEALGKMMENARLSFQNTYDSLGEELSRAADLLLSARRIEIYCGGSSLPIGQTFYYGLMRLGLPAAIVTDPLMASLSAAQLTREDLAIAISHKGRTANTLLAAEMAKRHGAAILSMTSFAHSPLTEISDVSLVAISHEAQEDREAVVSHLTQMLLIDSLCAYIAAQRGPEALRHLDDEIEVLEQYRR